METTDFDRMVAQLADSAMLRFYSALQEGMTEHQASEQIIRTVLECCQEAVQN